MTTTRTAEEISEAWLTFINDKFMIENGCNRPHVIAEYKRLDTGGRLMQAREAGRIETDDLLEEIFQIQGETLEKFYTLIDSRSLALVNDRVQCGTELLTGFVRQGRQINTEGMESLEAFFRQILLQRPETQHPESNDESDLT